MCKFKTKQQQQHLLINEQSSEKSGRNHLSDYLRAKIVLYVYKCGLVGIFGFFARKIIYYYGNKKAYFKVKF